MNRARLDVQEALYYHAAEKHDVMRAWLESQIRYLMMVYLYGDKSGDLGG